MADEKDDKVMVKVRALKAHTAAGESYDVGDIYEVEESAVDNLAVLGMAVRVDEGAPAPRADGGEGG
jgi:hypothetical protein